MRQPAEFLPLADESGLLPALGRQVLAQACAALARWPARLGHRPPVLSLNLSASELRAAPLPTLFAATLAEHGLSPDALQLEVAEETLLALDREALERLAALRSMGSKVILDRCRGHLALLTALPAGLVSGINLDRSLIAALEEPPMARSMIGAILHLAQRADLTVTAVGVEQPKQARLLEDLGGFRQQGHLLCPPLPADELQRWLQAQPAVGR